MFRYEKTSDSRVLVIQNVLPFWKNSRKKRKKATEKYSYPYNPETDLAD